MADIRRKAPVAERGFAAELKVALFALTVVLQFVGLAEVHQKVGWGDAARQTAR